jgi:predicted transcriptional regulator YheO
LNEETQTLNKRSDNESASDFSSQVERQRLRRDIAEEIKASDWFKAVRKEPMPVAKLYKKGAFPLRRFGLYRELIEN